MPRTAIVAFCTMMRTSYWKLASWNSASTPRRDRRCAAFPTHADEVVVWSESGTFFGPRAMSALRS